MMAAGVAAETSGIFNDGPRQNSPEAENFNAYSGRESFIGMMNHLYGEDVKKEIRRFEVLRKKKAQLLCALTFLMRCRDTGTIPSFIRMKRTFTSAKAHRIYDRTEKALLRERIHDTRRQLANNGEELLAAHLKISNQMQRHDWDTVDRLTYGSLETTIQRATDRQKRKFDRCRPGDSNLVSKDMTRTVVNLSDRVLSPDETSVLAKGGKFAVTPKTVPVEDIIAGVEAGIRSLPLEAAEDIRSETARILRRMKPPRCNLARRELTALKDLGRADDVIILPADKGSATVILNADDYRSKIQDLLDPETYRSVPRDPTGAIVRKTGALLKQSSLPPEVKKSLHISEAVPPRLYGLPKIHKANVPLRPIVSTIGSPTYGLARHLAGLLRPFIGGTESYIRDSRHFIEKLHDITLGPEDILVSFDVVSLFTMVPVREALEQIQEVFPTDIAALFRHVLTTTYFQWDGRFYEQVDGVAMGSPLSPVVADFYMERFEQTVLRSASHQPRHWFRYVDDTFVVWSHGEEELDNFLTQLNGVHPRIQFTMEREEGGQLPFLDVLVMKSGDGTLAHRVYRKPTHTDRYLHRESNHHPGQKRAVMKTLIDRAIRICEPNLLRDELKHLESALRANGYSVTEISRAMRPRTSRRLTNDEGRADEGKVFLPYISDVTDRIGRLLRRHGVRTVFRPTRSIQQHLKSAKDARDPLTSGGVYRIPCSCGRVYIGTTKRSARTRIAEHKRACRLGQPEKSALAEHLQTHIEHEVKFEDTKILSSTLHYSTRLHREAIEIYKHGNTLNRKEETMRLNRAWCPLLVRSRIAGSVT